MRPSITLALLLGATVGATAVACRDATGVAPLPTLDNESGSGGGSGTNGDGTPSDSSSTPSGPGQSAPADPAPPSGADTAVNHPPPPVGVFTLHGIIRGEAPGGDSTRTVTLPGVTASLYRVKSADGTPIEPAVLVGSQVADQLSEVTFPDLPSAHYRIEVKAPAGGPYTDVSVTITPPTARSIAIYLLLRRKG
jgi:hypothetical protein